MLSLLVPVFMHCSRLISNNKDLLTYLLTYVVGIDDIELSMKEIRQNVDRMPFNNREMLIRLIIHLQMYLAFM